MRFMGKTSKKNSTGRRLGMIASGLMMTVMVFMGTAQGHNAVMNGSLSPASGSTISASGTTLSGTFGNSGCGLGATIGVTVESGTVSPVTASCVDGTWSWSADWSGYDSGYQTVTVSFWSCCHGGPNNYAHSGTIIAEYYIPEECPAAPAIANHYMHDELGIRDRDDYNYVIPEVAHEMQLGTFGNNPCDPAYADAVIDFVNQLLGIIP